MRKLPVFLVAGAAALATLSLQLGIRPTASVSPSRAAPPKPLMPLPRLSPEGVVAFEILDAATGERIPGKLTFVGILGTPDPLLTHGDIGREDEGGISAYNRTYTIAGVGAVRVPHGAYDIYVSRGLEWDRYVARNVRLDARGFELRAPLRRAFETPGWISADFHVHAAKSSDSRVPMIDRVYEFAADGVEMIVSTDHNVLSDYAPYIAEAGAGKYLHSAIGDELTSNGWGHFGAFPLPEDLEAPGGGSVLLRGRNAHDFFRDIRAIAPDAVIDIHHPRIDQEIGYFNLGQLDSANDEARRPGFSYDFDAVEVLNGYQDPERRSVDRNIEDWFSLIEHGHLVTATGNSDSHHLKLNIGGFPRNYVAVAEDRPAALKSIEVARAVKGHHSFFTTGPFVDLRVNRGRLGEVVLAKEGKAHVEIDVSAAPWVAVSEVRVYLDGKEKERFAVPPSSESLRFHKTLDWTLQRDGFVVVRVDGDKPMTPIVGDNKRFTVYPLALTNPVFLDVDGNGAFDAPKRSKVERKK